MLYSCLLSLSLLKSPVYKRNNEIKIFLMYYQYGHIPENRIGRTVKCFNWKSNPRLVLAT